MMISLGKPEKKMKISGISVSMIVCDEQYSR
jgi:hypothetical protein